MSDFATRRAAFRKLHESGCFVIPNPWDAGTARYLEHLGFPALATTSAGFGFARGRPDHSDALDRNDVLDHIRLIVGATKLPVNADYQSGYADHCDELAESVRLCVATGTAGLSIEDATVDAANPLFDLQQAVDRVQAARQSIDDSGEDVLLTARAECFLVNHPGPLGESVRRLQAYADAGADVLFAPGLKTVHDIKTIVDAVAPKPVNVLVSSNAPFRVPELAALGVRRISVGSALARVAWKAFMEAADLLAEQGSFAGFGHAASFAELNSLFMHHPTPCDS